MKHAGYPYTQSDAFINAQRKKCEHCGELHHPSVRCRCRCVHHPDRECLGTECRDIGCYRVHVPGEK